MLKSRLRPPQGLPPTPTPCHARFMSSVSPARSNFRPNPCRRPRLLARPPIRWLSQSAVRCMPRRPKALKPVSSIGPLDPDEDVHYGPASSQNARDGRTTEGPNASPSSSAGPSSLREKPPRMGSAEPLFDDYDFHRCLRHIELREKIPSESSRRSFVSYIRLRESCKCPACLDPLTQQKNITLGQVIEEVENCGFHDYGTSKELIRVIPATDTTAACLEIQWGYHDDAHVSICSRSDLIRMSRVISHPSSRQRARTWGNAELLVSKAKEMYGGDSFAYQYDELVDAAGQVDPNQLGLMLKQLTTLGLVLLKGVPTDKTSDQDCALRRVANWIGPIRNTFYGETWDVINKRDESRNVAYTDKDLGLHMDLMYFENPPRFQLLHCLRNKVQGGQSYFVDGFHVRHDMMQQCRPEFIALKRFRIPFVYKNDGHDLVAHRAVFEREPFTSELSTIAWSPPFQGATGTVGERYWRYEDRRPRADFNVLYLRGISEWERRINDPEAKYEFTMEEGDLVLFDNRRVLHARRGFRDLTEDERRERGVEVADGEPSRWLKGCYLDGDAVWDKLAVLKEDMRRRILVDGEGMEEAEIGARLLRERQGEVPGLMDDPDLEEEDDVIGEWSERW